MVSGSMDIHFDGPDLLRDSSNYEFLGFWQWNLEVIGPGELSTCGK